jgi:hypothetical protein
MATKMDKELRMLSSVKFGMTLSEAI